MSGSPPGSWRALEKQGRRSDIPLASFPTAPISRANTAVSGGGGLLQINRPWKSKTPTTVHKDE